MISFIICIKKIFLLLFWDCFNSMMFYYGRFVKLYGIKLIRDIISRIFLQSSTFLNFGGQVYSLATATQLSSNTNANRSCQRELKSSFPTHDFPKVVLLYMIFLIV